jgi:hypothetical protein
MAQLAGRAPAIGAERMALDARTSLARRGRFSARTGVGPDEQPRLEPEPRGAPQSRPQLGRLAGTGLGLGHSYVCSDGGDARSGARPARPIRPMLPDPDRGLSHCRGRPGLHPSFRSFGEALHPQPAFRPGLGFGEGAGLGHGDKPSGLVRRGDPNTETTTAAGGQKDWRSAWATRLMSRVPGTKDMMRWSRTPRSGPRMLVFHQAAVSRKL